MVKRMRKEDYIPRGEAEKVLLQKAVADSDRNRRVWAKAICMIKDIPAADVEPKRNTGRWIDLDDHLLCSSCGASHSEPDKNYCPNCGARMMSDDEIADGIGQTFSPD